MLSELLTPEEVAKIRRTKKGVLAVERCRRQGPPFVKSGRRILYPRELLEQWLQGRLVVPEPAQGESR